MEKRTIRSYSAIKEGSNSILTTKDPETVIDMNEFNDDLKVDVAKFVDAFAKHKLNDWRTQTTIAGTALANRIEEIQMLLLLVSSAVAGNSSDAAIIQAFESKYTEILSRIQQEKKTVTKRGGDKAEDIRDKTSIAKDLENKKDEEEDK